MCSSQEQMTQFAFQTGPVWWRHLFEAATTCEILRVSPFSAPHRPAFGSVRVPDIARSLSCLRKKEDVPQRARSESAATFSCLPQWPSSIGSGSAGKNSRKPFPAHWECGCDREQSAFLTSPVTAPLCASFQTHRRNLLSCRRKYSTFKKNKNKKKTGGVEGGGRQNNTLTESGEYRNDLSPIPSGSTHNLFCPN